MEIHKLPERKFKIIVLKKPNELQEDNGKQFSEIRKIIQHNKLNTEIRKNVQNQTNSRAEEYNTSALKKKMQFRVSTTGLIKQKNQ